MSENTKTLQNSGETLDKSLFERIDRENIHDQAFETKPVSYLKDCFRRFRKNKGSVVAAIIILLIILYAIIVPIASPRAHVSPTAYPNGYLDNYFKYALPYNPMFAGTGFWDGTKIESLNERSYAIQTLTDANRPYIVETLEKTHDRVMAGDIVISDTVVYSCRVDTYAVGVKRIDLSPSAYQNLVDYEEENGIAGTADSIIKPSVDYETYLTDYADHLRGNGVIDTLVTTIINEMRTYYENNPGIYYALSAYPDNDETQQPSDKSNMFSPIYGENGNVMDLYIRDDAGDLVYGTYGQGRYTLRVDYFDYSTYFNGFEPYLFFGANAEGRDIFLRLAEGARFSLILGVCISLINFIIGLIWGAVSGYYGGTADLVMERVTDIIGNVPSIVVLTICSVSFTSNGAMMGKLGSAGVLIVSILLAFVYSGWIGTASTTRMQFYRYKGQEYVLASRTLGAKDRRLIFRHILPNAAGTLVTSSVLLVPGVIFSETSLSYLGLINFTTSGLCSIGSLLNEGQTAGLANYPHMLLFPCIVISLLMICFNLFGNGLRDAFNTTLKGAED